MEFTIKDNLRFLVETQSNYTNTVMYDEYGNPNIMVRISKEIYDKEGYGHYNNGLQGYVHGAFKLEGGKEVDEIWVSKYMNCMGNGDVPISMPNTLPAVNQNFEEARANSFKKGRGWHLMTNLEWATIIHRCHTCGAFPDPNPADKPGGFDTFSKTYLDPVSNVKYIYAGNGTMYGSHNMSVEGIYDMAGTIWEWVDGFRVTKYGQGGLQYHGENCEPKNLFMSNKYTSYKNLHFDISSADDDKWYFDVDNSYCRRQIASIKTTFGDFDRAGSNLYTDKSYDSEEAERVMVELSVKLPYWGSPPGGNLWLPGPAKKNTHPLQACRGGQADHDGTVGNKHKPTIYDLSLVPESTVKQPFIGYRTCYIDIG